MRLVTADPCMSRWDRIRLSDGHVHPETSLSLHTCHDPILAMTGTVHQDPGTELYLCRLIIYEVYQSHTSILFVCKTKTFQPQQIPPALLSDSSASAQETSSSATPRPDSAAAYPLLL